MASELRVNTLKDASGNNSIATSFVANGSAKAWANLNGTGTIALRDNFNVSSFTDNGTGQYTCNLTSATSDANYAVATSGYNDNSLYSLLVSVHEAAVPTTTTYRLACQQINTTTVYDAARVHSLVMGDLA